MSDNLTLNVNDILGIIQRQLAELNAYCSQPPNLVDPEVVMAYLERSASFAQRLPVMKRDVAANGSQPGKVIPLNQ